MENYTLLDSQSISQLTKNLAIQSITQTGTGALETQITKSANNIGGQYEHTVTALHQPDPFTEKPADLNHELEELDYISIDSETQKEMIENAKGAVASQTKKHLLNHFNMHTEPQMMSNSIRNGSFSTVQSTTIKKQPNRPPQGDIQQESNIKIIDESPQKQQNPSYNEKMAQVISSNKKNSVMLIKLANNDDDVDDPMPN